MSQHRYLALTRLVTGGLLLASIHVLAPPANAESATAVLRQSALAMRGAGTQHTEGQLAAVLGARRAVLRVTADCDTRSAPRNPSRRAAEFMRARSWVRGTGITATRRIQRVDAHFVEIGYADAARVWERSLGTRGVWRRERWTDATDFRTFLPDACPIGFQGVPSTQPPAPPGKGAPTWQIVGVEQLQGRPVWHLRLRLPANSIFRTRDVYIDRSSHLWVRQRIAYAGNVIEAMDFSRYRQPVSIHIPVVGSTSG